MSILSAHSKGQQISFHKLNRTKEGQRHGLWVSYADSAKTILEWKGRFKDGNERGVWRYYHRNGSIRKKEKYCFRKIKTSTYHENGKIESTGFAKMDEGENKLEYYYYGPWKYYSEDGKLIRIAHYEKGDIIKEETIK